MEREIHKEECPAAEFSPGLDERRRLKAREAGGHAGQENGEREKKFRSLDKVIEQYSREPGQLIRILQKAQGIFGYLPEDVQEYIAEKTGVRVSEISGVVTFYSFFTTVPKGKHTLNVCMGTACYVKGAQSLMDAIQEKLKIGEGETTPDGLFNIKSTRCIGACGLAPVLVVNDDVHGEASVKDVKKVIDELRPI